MPAVPPTAPTNVVATASNEGASVRWSPSTNEGDATIANYVVYAYNSQGQSTHHVVVPSSSTFAVFGSQTTNNGLNLTNAQPYYFNVTAINSSAQLSPASALSNTVTPGTDPMAGAGERSRFTTHSFGLTDWMSATVNVGTGNLQVSATDITLPAIGGGTLPIGRVYNSLSAAPGATAPSPTCSGTDGGST